MSELIWGTWNAICDRCAFKKKAFELRKEWTGQMVCKDCFEHRHPQDLIKVPKDTQSVPWSRPEPVDVFVSVTYVAGTVGQQGPTVPAGTFEGNNGTL